jgi:hypothetical protein
MTNEEQVENQARGGWLPERFQARHLEIIKTQYKETYESNRKDIWDRLITLDTNLTILEELNGSIVLRPSYPLMMASRELDYVFRQMAWAVYGESIILISTLLYDDDKTSLEVERFKTFITDKWIKPEYKATFQKECHIFHKLSEKTKELGNKIRLYRNTYYAHRNCDPEKVNKVKLVGIPKLREAFKIAEAFFDCCTLWVPEAIYLSDVAQKGIGELSDTLVKTGFFVNQVERLNGWHRMTTEELRHLNELRSKYGLPAIFPSDLKLGIIDPDVKGASGQTLA